MIRYAVQENGQVERLGQLTALSAGERCQWLLESSRAPGSIFASEFSDGLFPGWPWFLEDLRPSGTGEVVERRFKPALPKPEDQAAWLEMYPHAITYWQQVRQCPDISADFQNIAKQAITTLQHIHKIAAN